MPLIITDQEHEQNWKELQTLVPKHEIASLEKLKSNKRLVFVTLERYNTTSKGATAASEEGGQSTAAAPARARDSGGGTAPVTWSSPLWSGTGMQARAGGSGGGTPFPQASWSSSGAHAGAGVSGVGMPFGTSRALVPAAYGQRTSPLASNLQAPLSVSTVMQTTRGTVGSSGDSNEDVDWKGKFHALLAEHEALKQAHEQLQKQHNVMKEAYSEQVADLDSLKKTGLEIGQRFKAMKARNAQLQNEVRLVKEEMNGLLEEHALKVKALQRTNRNIKSTLDKCRSSAVICFMFNIMDSPNEYILEIGRRCMRAFNGLCLRGVKQSPEKHQVNLQRYAWMHFVCESWGELVPFDSEADLVNTKGELNAASIPDELDAKKLDALLAQARISTQRVDLYVPTIGKTFYRLKCFSECMDLVDKLVLQGRYGQALYVDFEAEFQSELAFLRNDCREPADITEPTTTGVAPGSSPKETGSPA